jgi:hypothetical protein
MIQGMTALDELLEIAYGHQFAWLDLAELLDDPGQLVEMVAPFLAVTDG